MRTALSGVAIGLALTLAAPAPAFAHNYLVDSTPDEASTLTEVPEEFTVTTNEPLLDVSGEAAGFALQVRDANGGYYGDGCLTVEGATLSTPAQLGEAGEYTIGWQVVSGDGHTVSGEFAFAWEPAPDFVPAPAADAPPSCGEAGATGGAAAPTEPTDPPSDAGAVSGTDLLWVLGTVVAVAVVLFGTLLLFTRRRSAPKR
ncbi:copper resistance protein CopC [Lysobacter korlensis]|uniref:Copper resistance protein C n=1 Tax=Lysobacter korlensis TaxID=553636 RepID=A0ABV6RN10_9GAMM